MRDIPAPPRCELCGALIDSADQPEPEIDPHRLLSALADIYLADHRLLGIVLLSATKPQATARWIAQSLGISPARVSTLTAQLQAVNPAIADALRIIRTGHADHRRGAGGAVPQPTGPRHTEGQRVTAVDRNGRPVTGTIAQIVLPGRRPSLGIGGANHVRTSTSYVIRTDAGTIHWPPAHTVRTLHTTQEPAA